MIPQIPGFVKCLLSFPACDTLYSVPPALRSVWCFPGHYAGAFQPFRFAVCPGLSNSLWLGSPGCLAVCGFLDCMRIISQVGEFVKHFFPVCGVQPFPAGSPSVYPRTAVCPAWACVLALATGSLYHRWLGLSIGFWVVWGDMQDLQCIAIFAMFVGLQSIDHYCTSILIQSYSSPVVNAPFRHCGTQTGLVSVF